LAAFYGGPVWRASDAPAFAKLFERQLEPALREAGAEVVAAFSTEHHRSCVDAG
jgi:hypothetical protein